MNNSLSVNLLLTGVVARLASYPQPLIRSFLLNHSVVFHPSIKSLIQVREFIAVFTCRKVILRSLDVMIFEKIWLQCLLQDNVQIVLVFPNLI